MSGLMRVAASREAHIYGQIILSLSESGRTIAHMRCSKSHMNFAGTYYFISFIRADLTLITFFLNIPVRNFSLPGRRRRPHSHRHVTVTGGAPRC